jgi:hypothetical protein
MTLSSYSLIGQLSIIPEKLIKYEKYIFIALGMNLIFIIFAIYLLF